MFTETEQFERLYQGALKMPCTGSRTIHSDAKFAHTDQLVLMSICENAYLLNLSSQKVTYLDWIYGDVVCGIISHDETWAAVGGFRSFTVWHDGSIQSVAFSSAHDLRQSGPDTLLVLEDPWFEDPHVWEYNVRTKALAKVRPFPDYAGKPFTHNVIW